jgi:hypothetical protein
MTRNVTMMQLIREQIHQHKIMQINFYVYLSSPRISSVEVGGSNSAERLYVGTPPLAIVFHIILMFFTVLETRSLHLNIF